MIPLWLLTLWFRTHGVLKGAWAFWRGLPGPVQWAVIGALGWLVGELHGAHVERARCAARIEASVKAAEARDAEIAAGAHEMAQRQAGEADARASAVKEEVRTYVDEVAKRTAAACATGADADRYNDGLRVQDDGIQPARPDAAPGRGHRAEPRPVPSGKGQR